MVKNFLLKGLYILTVLVTVVNTVISVAVSLNPDINDLPEGTLSVTFPSPNGISRIDIYVVESTFGNAVRGDYVCLGEHRNIYWQTDADTARVRWLSEKSIIIENIPLNVKTDKYDSRRGTAIFSEGILAENISEND